MKCPKCGGKGKVLYPGVADYYVKCNKCDGTGEVEATNDEWFNTLSTNDKAEAIAHLLSTDEIEYTSIHFRVLRWLEAEHGRESEQHERYM